MKNLYLVDVSSMFFRAFYAIRSLTNSKGLPTNAIYGFLAMTVKLMREIRPDYMGFCFDRPEPSFRRDVDPRYKANRAEMPEDLQPQIPYIRKLAHALGVPCYDRPGFEADDIIGTLTNFGRTHDLEVVIVSSDKDFGQLLQPCVSMYDTMKDVRYDVEAFREKWGVPPGQMIDFLAITGDTSDNIPGISGIGKVGAQKLLAEYGTLEGIYANLDKIKSLAMVKKLEDGRDEAWLSRKLVTIVSDIDMGVSLGDLKLRPIVRDELRQLLDELEFKAFARTLLGEGPESPATPAFISAAGGVLPVSTGPVPANSNGHATAVVADFIPAMKEVRIPVAGLREWVNEATELWGMQTPRGILIGKGDEVAEIDGATSDIGPALENCAIRWKGFDLKEFWHATNFASPEASWDQMLAAYVIRAGTVAGLSELVTLYLGEALPEIPSASHLYSIHLRLEAVLRKKISAVGGERVLNEIELPLIPVLFAMERNGIRIDRADLENQSVELERELRRLETEIHQDAGEAFNIGSPKQMAHILFEKLQMPHGRKTKTGYSTDVDVLMKLAPTHPIINKILLFREASKLKSTYVDQLPAMCRRDTGRVHTSFNQAATTTGRLSSTNPNLQNIPIRTARGARIRRAFVADEGNRLISADYSQIELRILAHISADAGLVRAFIEDADVHTATAAEIFGVAREQVTAEMRRKAKAVNFGIAYGQEVFGLAEALGVERAEAKEIIVSYFTKFPGVKTYMEETIETAKSKGFVETMFGRRRYLDELYSKSPAIRKFGERAAINAPIQGTASDLVKLAMINAERDVHARLLLQVHDELIFEVPVNEVDACKEAIRKAMESVNVLRVPLKVNIESGRNWDETN